MDLYSGIKLVHIVSATLLFGTGLGIAFFFWTTHRTGDVAAIAIVSRYVVLADLVFTTPAVILQPATGLWLANRLALPLDTPWLAASLGLYVVTGICWLPVVWLQWRMSRLANDAFARNEPLPDAYHRHVRWWFALGWPAFCAVLAIFALMVFKRPG